MNDPLIMTTAGHAGRYATRTTGEAHLYRVTQYYDSWPFEISSRVRAGTASRRRTETFRTLEPVRQRLARANLYARHQHRNGGDWASFAAVAEQLTDHGWQPLDLDVLPPRPAGTTRNPQQAVHRQMAQLTAPAASPCTGGMDSDTAAPVARAADRRRLGRPVPATLSKEPHPS